MLIIRSVRLEGGGEFRIKRRVHRLSDPVEATLAASNVGLDVAERYRLYRRYVRVVLDEAG